MERSWCQFMALIGPLFHEVAVFSHIKSMTDPGNHFEDTFWVLVTISNHHFNWLLQCSWWCFHHSSMTTGGLRSASVNSTVMYILLIPPKIQLQSWKANWVFKNDKKWPEKENLPSLYPQSTTKNRGGLQLSILGSAHRSARDPKHSLPLHMNLSPNSWMSNYSNY